MQSGLACIRSIPGYRSVSTRLACVFLSCGSAGYLGAVVVRVMGGWTCLQTRRPASLRNLA
jgi:hypothetical protein